MRKKDLVETEKKKQIYLGRTSILLPNDEQKEGLNAQNVEII